MGRFSIYHWLIVVFVVLLLFCGRKIPELMKGVGEGMRSFKEGMAGESSASAPPTQLNDQSPSHNASGTKGEHEAPKTMQNGG